MTGFGEILSIKMGENVIRVNVNKSIHQVLAGNFYYSRMNLYAC